MIETLVTGGTGLIGSAIARRLVQGSESVRILSRNPLRIARERRIPGCAFVKGDVFEPAALAAAMEGCDAVINAVQFDNAPFEHPQRGLTYERIDGEGTERQVQAAKQAGVKRFIYLSGAGTREGRAEPWFRAKLRAEKAVRESGLHWTIFRPSWVYGPQDRSLNKFAMFARVSPVVPIVGSGKEKIQPLFVNDLAEAVLLSLNGAAGYGRVYEIGGPETLTMRAIVRTMLRVMGKRRLILPQPKWVMKLLAWFVEFLPPPLRFLTRDGVDFVTMQEKVDISLLLKDFPMELTPLEKGLASYLSRPLPSSLAFPEEREV